MWDKDTLRVGRRFTVDLRLDPECLYSSLNDACPAAGILRLPLSKPGAMGNGAFSVLIDRNSAGGPQLVGGGSPEFSQSA
ncbi:MAG: hypothetical protein QNJ46_35850 [Leptolyngbyaceae cyanobacterium MO_188.B28]|nr:hypothetical protein [Leptolyngbyaceae cyanobacterium MO_188.B28]